MDGRGIAFDKQVTITKPFPDEEHPHFFLFFNTRLISTDTEGKKKKKECERDSKIVEK